MRSLSRLLPLAVLALPYLACSSDKDHAKRLAAPEGQFRHVDYSKMSQAQLKLECISTDIGGPRVDLVDASGMPTPDGIPDPPVCATPDPGSRTINCGKAIDADHYDYAWTWDLATDAKARATYTYDDNSALFVVPDRITAWEPTPDPVDGAATQCAPNPDGTPFAAVPFTQAIRFKGGPFSEFGGGFGQSFRTTSHNVNTYPPASHPGLAALEATPSPEFPDPQTGAYDLRSWTGVAIWIRRGPLGMSTLRLGITEKHSAEDLNSEAIVQYAPVASAQATGVQEGKYCKRWRLCGCAAGVPCSPLKIGDATFHYCFDPAYGTPDPNHTDFSVVGLQKCGEDRCLDKNTSTGVQDPSWVKTDANMVQTAACNEAWTDDGRVDMFCYDPKTDPPPPAKRERCNNPFSKPVTVSTDWQLIRVPFSEMRQADEANVADDMDLSSVKQIVFTFGGGWADFWIADIGIYRAK